VIEPQHPLAAAGAPHHDLMNLLQAVQGYLELLAGRTEDETSQRYVANARTAAEQMADAIRALPRGN
jgi:signal transduction histidine kinase